MGFVLRWIAAFGLLTVTFNPTEWNYVRWARENWSDAMPVIVLAGLLLAVAYAVFVTAVLRGIGRFGALLVLAVVAAFVWVLVDFGWVSLEDPGAVTWVVIAALSVVLAMGMYWGILWRRISGQLEVDDEEG
ncbi:MAG: DUF6524 family protein [Paracoccaceae bacterium]|nr:DUF6524 family protein [Paracoccaceae bacterium]